MRYFAWWKAVNIELDVFIWSWVWPEGIVFYSHTNSDYLSILSTTYMDTLSRVE